MGICWLWKLGIHWDKYAWLDGQQALQDIHKEQDTADQQDHKTKKQKSNSKRKTQGKEEEQKDRTKKASKRSEPSAASAENVQKPKLSRKQDTSAAPKQKAKKAKKETEETETAEVEPPPGLAQRLAPPPKKIRKIQKYVTPYKDSTATAADASIKVDMRSSLRISEFNECRLNIYWKTSACGCTSYSKNKDIAYFNFGGNDARWNYMTRMAMALKCAEMFVTWVHQVKSQ